MEMYAREKEFGIFLSEKFSSTKETVASFTKTLETRRHLKRYGVMSSTYQLLYMYRLCSVAEFVSWYSKKCGRKICFSVPILSASETSIINCSSEAK